MDKHQGLQDLIDRSFRQQKLIFYGMGIVSALTGVGILILSLVAPVNPGEEAIVSILQAVAVVFILFCGWSFWYVRRRIRRVQHLIFEAPQQIEQVKSVTVQKRGVAGRAIRIYTQDGGMVGFNVPGPQAQEQLMALLKARLQA